MNRLSEATLASLPAGVARPGYDRSSIAIGVVHFGIGAFHRAHQAIVFDDALAAGDSRWAVCGVSLRSPGVRDQLAPQDGLYTVIERSGASDRVRVVGAIRSVLVAPENPGAVIDALAAPDTHLATLTITEKGYKLSGGTLDWADPDIVHDLAQPEQPRSAIGFLVAGLARRRTAGRSPFTVLSCDNLPHNGQLLRDAVLAFAGRLDPALARWIETEAAFPQSMVDRIVPATTDDDVATLALHLGVEDRAMVKTEPFLQWVIEDRFCGPRPDFDRHGARLTTDIAPWEQAKLRLLNGAHSAIAYWGGLIGIEHVHEFVALEEGRAFVEALWDESAATLSPPPDLNLDRYRADLMARFANPALRHRTGQIAMDGTQKLPQRIVAPLAARQERGAASPVLTAVLAAWVRWAETRIAGGGEAALDDPLARRLATMLGRGGLEERIDAILSIDTIFPASIVPTLRPALIVAYQELVERGARGALIASGAH